MYEYEIIYKSNGEHDFLFGYSLRDLARRYPEIDPNSYTIVYREYIDWNSILMEFRRPAFPRSGPSFTLTI